MRVVITGCNGQLGRQLQTVFADEEQLGLDLPTDDITDPAAVERIAAFEPNLVLHPAAFTNVDACEQDPDLAFRVNVFGTQNVALAARRAGAPMLYISTNEVFDGSRREAYREWDQTTPMSVYARTKAAGEQIVRDLAPDFYIVRIAWLFGPGGVNFVTKILANAEKSGALRVAADEFGNPTYAPDLAAAIRKLVGTRHYGIYHLTNRGFCSRFEFAAEILRLAGRSDIPITPILSAEWPRPSRPPLHSVLADTAAAALGISMRPWQEALAEYVPTLHSTGSQV
jgi:dTDP-4-dehydrorhamnose reductase